MTDPNMTIDIANMRMARAVSTVRDVLENSAADTTLQIAGAMERVVIALNSLAHVLKRESCGSRSGDEIAETLWSFGEGLGIRTDGARD